MRAQVLAASVILLLSAACSDAGRVGRSRPAIAADPLAVDFGPVKTGASRTLSVTLTNEGTAALTFQGNTFRGDARGAFSAGALPTVLAPGERAAVELTYAAPAEEGADGAQWIVLSDANNAPELALSLSGRADRACAAGLTQCGGACVDLQADSSHCGSCAVTCTLPERCLSGKCGCIARTCNDVGECGTADDGCGGTLDCGGCAGQSTCMGHRCIPPTCSDGLQNQGETDVDCGGPCQRCTEGKHCAARSDCVTGLACTAGTCSACTSSSDCASDQVCRNGRCGECQSRAECGGGRACMAGRCLGCPDEAQFNECGLCGGPPVSGLGASCTLSNNCTSTWVCDPDQTRVVCAPVAKNECGLCAGQPISGLGDACASPGSGCNSTLDCNANNSGTVCTEVPRNACGLCAGPAITGLGDPCTLANGCSSTQVCDAQQSNVTCAPVAKNACGVCGGVEVTGKGDACTLPNGCTSTLACNVAGDGTVCTDVKQNACGACGVAEPSPPTGTPASSWVKDAVCTGASGCPGTLDCNAAGTDFECNAPSTCYLAQHVVISQVCGYGPSGDDFIELYNPTGNDVSLDGYTLWYRNYANVTSWNKGSNSFTFPAGTVIKKHGYLLGTYASANYTFSATPDFNYTFDSAVERGQWLLWKDATTPPLKPTPTDALFVDFVGYGVVAAWSEGSPTRTPAQGQSVLRKASPSADDVSMHVTTGPDRSRGNGTDTNDNTADFVPMPAGTYAPRNSSFTATP